MAHNYQRDANDMWSAGFVHLYAAMALRMFEPGSFKQAEQIYNRMPKACRW